MNITPVIPDGYTGPIKRLTCRICKHIFYLTQADYGRLAEVSYCHECSLILAEELEKHQVARSSISPKQTAVPVSHPPEPAFTPVKRPPEPAIASSRPSVRVPQPRTIDRHKMTVDQLLEEAKILDKTWRYTEALASYEQVLHCDPGCLAALYGKGEMLRQLSRPAEAFAVYEEILLLDPTAVKAATMRGWTLISLRRYEEALAAFDQALQLDPSASEPENGRGFILTHIRLVLLCPQSPLVWRRASKTQAFLDGCEPDRGLGSSLHPVVESTLSRQQECIGHEGDKSGKVEGENEREDSAVRAGQGYAPNLG